MAFRVALAYGKKLDDAAFDLVEIKVIFVQHLARGDEIEVVRGFLRPRKLDQPVEIGAHHRVFGGGLGHALEAFQFALGLFARRIGHAGLGDRLAKFLDLDAFRILALAEFLLDLVQLLAQDELALLGAHGLLRFVADARRDAQHLQALGKMAADFGEPPR